MILYDNFGTAILKLSCQNVNMIKMDLLDELRKHIKKPEITLIVGPRQAGKTTIMKALEEELTEKLSLMNEIYQSYLERDIYYLLKIQKLPEFSKLVKILADSTGKILNFSEISNTAMLSVKTLKEYLWYLEKTFIVSRITPFYRNIRKELSKSPIYYFYDLGLRNFSIGEFGRVREYSFLFQNFIYLILLEKIKNTPYQIHFWRTKDKAEIDFIIDAGNSLIPVEVKYKELKTPEITRALRSFIARYAPEKALIINLSLYEKSWINNTEVITMPFYRLFEYNLA